MKGYNTLYYLLFVILILGAFASIAQNSYGLKIIGGVSISFGILFLIQFVDSLTQKPKASVYLSAELFCLCILAIIFALRVFYFTFPYVELLFAVTSLVLIAIYCLKMIDNFRFFQSKNVALSILVSVFYLAIIFYFLSLGLINFQPAVSETAGIIAFSLLVTFAIAGLIKRYHFVNGERTSAFHMLTKKRDHAIIILSLFILFTLYKGLTMTGILPKIYSDEFPQAYFELVNRAESGKERPVDGKYKHIVFKEQYDEFVKRSR